jgi:hypothetical protein
MIIKTETVMALDGQIIRRYIQRVNRGGRIYERQTCRYPRRK